MNYFFIKVKNALIRVFGISFSLDQAVIKLKQIRYHYEYVPRIVIESEIRRDNFVVAVVECSEVEKVVFLDNADNPKWLVNLDGFVEPYSKIYKCNFIIHQKIGVRKIKLYLNGGHNLYTVFVKKNNIKIYNY